MVHLVGNEDEAGGGAADQGDAFKGAWYRGGSNHRVLADERNIVNKVLTVSVVMLVSASGLRFGRRVGDVEHALTAMGSRADVTAWA